MTDPDPLTDDELNYVEARAHSDINRVRPVHVLSLVAEVRRLRRLRPSATAALLQVAAPHGALDRILRWVESLRGTTHRTTLDCTLVGNGGEWVQLLVARDPEVYGRGRRRPVAGGVDDGPPSSVPSE